MRHWEFLDLLPMIDWCASLKLDVIQLLPLNHSAADPSPYNSISSCALGFIYLSLRALPFLNKLPELEEKCKEFAPFNQTDRLHYAEVLTHKENWLRAYFEAVGGQLLKSEKLKTFIQENPWLESYALFSSLRKAFGETPWTAWPVELKAPSKEERENLLIRYGDEIAFYITIQFLCHEQLKQVKTYANQHGVLLMGDIPILLSGDSADVWSFPEYFDLTHAAGVPPDAYNQEGQYWGFPLFRWEILRKNGYDWWKQRLHYASHFYDLYRIDHVIGFFRIWAIPLGAPAREGKFVPDDEVQSQTQGEEFLSMLLQSSPMLPIAEDLGILPKTLPASLHQFGICGTKLLRWERNWETDKSFIPPADYSPLSLSCVSTHDSETLPLWWKTCPEEAKAFARFKQWEYTPELSSLQQQEILSDSHHSASLFHVNLLQEYLTLFPELRWPTPEQERINIPGTHLPSNWTYRFRPTVEEITSHQGLFERMQKILDGRNLRPTRPS